MKKTECNKCNRLVTNNNYKRHVETCDGTYFEGPHKNWIKRSHEESYATKLKNLEKARSALSLTTVWNKGLTKDDPRVKKYAESIKSAHADGKVDRSFLNDPEYRQKLKDNAKKQGFGGYRKNAGRSKKYRVRDSFGNEVVLQSSYELRCFEILTELEIKWIRPPYLKYGSKKYFADFYLTEHDVYLDPKNNYKAVQDAEKIACVCEENSVKVYVLTEDMLTQEYIKNIVL